jgi:hypothetical protein
LFAKGIIVLRMEQIRICLVVGQPDTTCEAATRKIALEFEEGSFDLNMEAPFVVRHPSAHYSCNVLPLLVHFVMHCFNRF